jgi:hypothetical protein
MVLPADENSALPLDPSEEALKPLDSFAQLSAVRAALIARAKSFELDTPYVPPPGNALEHHASGRG